MSSPSFSDRMTNRRPLPLPSLLFPLRSVSLIAFMSHRMSHCTCSTVSKKKKTFQQRPGTRTYGQNFVQVWQGNLSKQKHSIGQKKSQKLNNAGKLRGIYHIDPEDKEFNDPPENRRITLNCAWTPQCHVNCERQQRIHSKRRLRTHKTKFALSSGMERILAKNTQKKPNELCYKSEAYYKSTRKQMQETNNRDHEDHVVEKGHNSTRHCNIVHKPILLLQTILDAKAAVDKEWES